MESLSDSYGWTPKQIREQRIEDILAYLEIRNMKEALKKNEMKKQK